MGGYFICSLNVLISSIPLLDAPSISITSIFLPSVISLQFEQPLQGSKFCKLLQLSAFAIMRAVVVLPTPRGPVKA